MLTHAPFLKENHIYVVHILGLSFRHKTQEHSLAHKGRQLFHPGNVHETVNDL